MGDVDREKERLSELGLGLSELVHQSLYIFNRISAGLVG